MSINAGRRGFLKGVGGAMCAAMCVEGRGAFGERTPPAADYSTDVLVVGGGPAGVCAAIAAARNGAKVMVVEQSGMLGARGKCFSRAVCKGKLT